MLLVDTDVMIDLTRRNPAALAWLKSLGEEQLVLPGFVVMELIQGCRTKLEQQKIKRALKPFAIAWPDSDACNQALSVFSEHYLSEGIGIIDALVGQLAVSLNLPLCTFNRKHYTVIPQIQVLEPYSRETSQR